MAENDIKCLGPLSPRQTLNGQRVRIPGPAMKIATWNVRTLFEGGKFENAVLEMERMGIDVLGVSEVRWSGSGERSTSSHTIYYSGNDDVNHRNGVAVIVSKAAKYTVKNFVPLSDRVMILQFDSKPVSMNVIQVYAPTTDADDDAVEAFYAEVKNALRLTKAHEVNIVMGDFNAKIGRGSVGGVIGMFGLILQYLLQYCNGGL